MKPECCLCGSCMENNKKRVGKLNLQGGQWLEEVGEMIEEAVTGIRKKRSDVVRCNGRLPTYLPG